MPPKIRYRHTAYRPKAGDPNRPRTVRGAYIYNLVDCLQTCLLRRDLDRARRAWAILVRCPDVHWHDLWLWGLYLLTDGADSSFSRFSQNEPGKEGERYLQSLQVAAKDADKPVILCELVQHLIRVGRYRAALEELEMYISSFPYLNSAQLLTYAGLLHFYLAQPESARGGSATDNAGGTKKAHRDVGEDESEGNSMRSRSMSVDSVDHSAPNPEMMRQARKWFGKALKVDPQLAVAKEFAGLIDGPNKDASDDEMDQDSFDRGETRERQPSIISVDSEGVPAASTARVGDDQDDDESAKWDDVDDKSDDKSDDNGEYMSDEKSDDKWDDKEGDPDADLWKYQRRRGDSISIHGPKMSTSQKVRASELASKNKADLLVQLTELRTELAALRVQKVVGGSSSKLTKINTVRKSIARVLTVVNQKQRQNLREFYKKSKYMPLDLRYKKTRAIRRRLTAKEAGAITTKAHKKAIHFPQRKFALKA
ncbi:uncharacterized protein CcaverHIS019_0101360 [Cutaneotrichosporon cavernicola]|uniref:60S ribosomal protein L35 n=1 Tax=Cutaneotrichosporon cavernicola TaxID=279322 RepID=A0AA48ICZ8_9TREE|nr:uncharacterized protein CcaverHIS019_0101360 [Cutaneotrichosporon cavernicola]BEI87418.1 hypothetical protein CcaverHIS019_0101360 [Cutaneotrichosporon cavernicola]